MPYYEKILTFATVANFLSLALLLDLSFVKLCKNANAPLCNTVVPENAQEWKVYTWTT